MNLFSGNYKNDCDILLEKLKTIEIVSGTVRSKMYKQSKNTGGSALYGYTWKSYLSPTKNRTPSEYQGLCNTKLVDTNPELRLYFKEFSKIHLDNFDFTQVQINKNFMCPPHFDSSNIGQSMMVALGDYTGGDTAIEFELYNPVYFDARKEPLKFNGALFKHWVMPWIGDRYTLVFFDNLKNKIIRDRD